MEKTDMKVDATRDLLALMDEMEARIREALAVLKKLEARLHGRAGLAENAWSDRVLKGLMTPEEKKKRYCRTKIPRISDIIAIN
jgi:hypothetical protein